jgi:hypothetical protein
MMNSSFLFFGQIILVTLTLVHTLALVIQFGFPRDTVRTLGILFLFTLCLMLLTDALAWKGVYLALHYPSIYGLYLGIMGLSWPAFVYLGVLDQPTQINRKIMWRLPILGALAGHALSTEVGLYIFAIGWLTGAGVILVHYKTQRYVARIHVVQFIIAILYWIFQRAGILIAAQVIMAVWIVLTHRMINAYLVKEKMRVHAARLSEVSV